MPVIAAFTCSFGFNHYFQISVPSGFYIVLSILVWLIYTIDHILDVRLYPNSLFLLRYKIHFLYQSNFIFLIIAGLIISLMITILQFEFYLILNGIILGIFMFIYFIIEKKYLKQLELKNILIALGFSLGIGIANNTEIYVLNKILILYLCCLIAYINVLSISIVDHKNDLKYKAIELQKPQLNIKIIILASLFYISIIFYFPVKCMLLIIPFIGIILLLYLSIKSKLNEDRVRILSDIILIVFGMILYYISTK